MRNGAWLERGVVEADDACPVAVGETHQPDASERGEVGCRGAERTMEQKEHPATGEELRIRSIGGFAWTG